MLIDYFRTFPTIRLQVAGLAVIVTAGAVSVATLAVRHVDQHAPSTPVATPRASQPVQVLSATTSVLPTAPPPTPSPSAATATPRPSIAHPTVSPAALKTESAVTSTIDQPLPTAAPTPEAKPFTATSTVETLVTPTSWPGGTAYHARVTITASAPIKTCSLWLAMNDGSGSTGPGTIQGDTCTYEAAASKAFPPGYPKLRYTVTAFDGQMAASAP